MQAKEVTWKGLRRIGSGDSVRVVKMAGQKRKSLVESSTPKRSVKKTPKKSKADADASADAGAAEDAKRAATKADRNSRMKKAMMALGRLGDDNESDNSDVEDRFVPLTEVDRDAENDEEQEEDASAESESESEQDEDEEAKMTPSKAKKQKVESAENVKSASKKNTEVAKKQETKKPAKKVTESRKDTITSKEGVIYLGHIPSGFFEKQMQGFFSQFGEVRRLRLSRSKKTGRSRGYAFVQFVSNEVAKIVQQAMDNYLLCDKLLVCSIVKPEDVHERMFANADRKFRRVNWAKVDGKKLNKERTAEEHAERLSKLKARHNKQQKKLKAKGIDYELPNYA